MERVPDLGDMDQAEKDKVEFVVAGGNPAEALEPAQQVATAGRVTGLAR